MLIKRYQSLSFLVAGSILALCSSLAAIPQSSEFEKTVEEALPKISEYAKEAFERTGVPGLAMVVVFQDEIVLMETMGTRRVGKDWPVTEDTVFQFASLSKPMTSSVVGAAVDRDLLDFSDTAMEHGVPLRLHDGWLSENVTVADLLSHRSSLPDHAGDFLEDLEFPVDTILERIGQLPPGYLFRAGYAYTNFGFTAGGMAAANAADMTFAELADEFIFEPLGMKDSSFRFSDFENSEERAYIHVRTEDDSWQELYVREPDAQAPAGGLSTTMNDFSRWMRMQLNEGEFEGQQIVSAAALSEIWRPHSQPGYNPELYKARTYGLGWNVSHDSDLGFKASHSGAFTMGVRTAVFLFPDKDLGIAVATNAGGHGIPEALGLAFEKLLTTGEIEKDLIGFSNQMFEQFEAEFMEYQIDESDRPESPAPAAEPSAYTGIYANDYYGPIQVREDSGELSFTIGPKPFTLALKHWDGDTFLFQPIGENSGGPGTVEFQRTGDGPSSSVTIPYFDGYGMGTFIRLDTPATDASKL